MTERILYQFPISHYCEKSRWQLDYKGLAYRTRNLLPGPHRLRTQWMARINTLPVLRDGQRVVGDSTKIAYYLEKHYPERSLIPTDAESRARVIELEQQLDRVAVHVRRWLYGQIIDRPEVMDAMLDPYRLPSPVQKVLAPVTREGVRRLYRIEPKAVAHSGQRLEEGLELVEETLRRGNGRYLVGEQAEKENASVVPICAKIESEIAELDDEEKADFLADLGMEEPGLNRVIRAGYELLGLQTYFTAGKKEVRAWTIKIGATAPQAAGVIHTDFEKGFIRAQTIAYDDYVAGNGEQGAKEAGKMRAEGKDYVVKDGDVLNFLFNV